MDEVSRLFGSKPLPGHFDQIRVSIASPEKIRSWSYGEVKKPETINYRNLKPERGGLFCAKIFGPTKDYECLCGKYKRVSKQKRSRVKPATCEKCGVEVTQSKVRRERMGHIELAAPVAHIWFLKSLPSRLGILLDLSLRDLERILYFEQYLVIEPGFTNHMLRRTLSKTEYHQAVSNIVLNQLFWEGELGEEQEYSNIKAAMEAVMSELEPASSDPRCLPDNQWHERLEHVVLTYSQKHALSAVATRQVMLLSQILLSVGRKVSKTSRRTTKSEVSAFAMPREDDGYNKAVISIIRQLYSADTGQVDRLFLDVITAVLSDLKTHQLLGEIAHERAVRIDELRREECRRAKKPDRGIGEFKAEIGAEALRTMLSRLNLKLEEQRNLRELQEATSEAKIKKLNQRLKLLNALIASQNRPEWMILEVIAVIPPDLRPLVPLDGGRFASSDLNDLYRRVINRNNRLKRLLALKSPELIIRNEKRLLQEAVDTLFDNGRRGKIAVGPNKRPLKSLSDMLRGKQGRFRQNLLGKRVDYSGRSVIVVGPELKLHQCGLPKRMALELFKPMVYAQLIKQEHASTLKAAKRVVEQEHREIWDALEEVIREHPVLLNRAPTLHRLGIQAFEPTLVEGKAIRLHPLVCTAFNADFDGDQMAVHVPLSLEAQIEARVLMMSTNNILSPANGKPIIVPSLDMVLGLYYLTMELDSAQGEGMIFADLGEVEQALEHKLVSLHARVTARVPVVDGKGHITLRRVQTTPGRMLLSAVLPLHPSISFDLINCQLSKSEVSGLVDTVYAHCGQKEVVIFADRIMKMGFEWACRSGISFGKDDMIVPELKDKLVSQATRKVKQLEEQYQIGNIDREEKYKKVVSVWNECTNQTTEAVIQSLGVTSKGGEVNSIYLMLRSGARGAQKQLGQLAGMRGAMSKPSGDIIETPIISNLKEGLTVLEYFNSTHGARKGMADTALKTANSGYLTRRLVDVSQNVVVVQHDCGTELGVSVRPVPYEKGSAPLSERIIGRTAAENIVDQSGKIIVGQHELIDETAADSIERSGIDSVRVRSPITCQAHDGICARCYGIDLARGSLANTGEAVGIIAAQSIGEPGTQLTMRTFHTGGAAQLGSEQSHLEASHNGTVRWAQQENLVVELTGGSSAVMGRNFALTIFDQAGNELTRHKIPYGARLLVRSGDQVSQMQKLAEWDPHSVPILTACSGTVHYRDLVDGETVREVINEVTAISSKVVVDWRQQTRARTRNPRIIIRNQAGDEQARYNLPPRAVLNVGHESTVQAGEILARVPREGRSKTRDITGGLPRIADLFEARVPKNAAVLANSDGRVSLESDTRGRIRRIYVIDRNGDKHQHNCPKNKTISVQDGDQVSRGDALTEGEMSSHAKLEALGVEGLADYFVNEVQKIYLGQGVKIDDKHIEVIIRQMLQKVKIIHPGDTELLAGELVDRSVLAQSNNKIVEQGGSPAIYRLVLQGITKASLQTFSFISAASFQDTTRVLTEAAIAGRQDPLFGLKENVIVGHLIPAGTGHAVRSFNQQAKERDQALAVQSSHSDEISQQLPSEASDTRSAQSDQETAS